VHRARRVVKQSGFCHLNDSSQEIRSPTRGAVRSEQDGTGQHEVAETRSGAGCAPAIWPGGALG
jgi:hypothetical protein